MFLLYKIKKKYIVKGYYLYPNLKVELLSLLKDLINEILRSITNYLNHFWSNLSWKRVQTHVKTTIKQRAVQ